ncbi:MAG: RNA 2',3'-cyclic phosphodiesterase [Gemmatimonadaceae bacterium]
MRLFVAANFHSALRTQLYDAAAPLRAAAPSVSWVAADRLHTTLKFIGEQDATFVHHLAASLRLLGTKVSGCDVRLAGYGAFPNFRRPRVVWIGGEPAAPLAAIAQAIDAATAALGLSREERPFRAHVTLGRVKRPLARDEALQLERFATARQEAFPWHVGSIEIMQSTLGRLGPAYSVLESIPLGAVP